MTKKIIIIGAEHIGLNAAIELAAKKHNVCVLHDVVDSNFADLREPEPLLIERFSKFKDPIIAVKEPIINYKKHTQTCTKKRKKRKKRRR